LSQQQRDDLTAFEGNAQGFRVITRRELYRDLGGMRLTMAVLGCFSKYPQGSSWRGDRQRAGGKKFGYFTAEEDLFARVAAACGLHPVVGQHGAWHRHPLAFVMEVADDICYHVLDLEDGVMLRLIEHHRAAELFGELLGRAPGELAKRPVSALRALAINQLVQEAVAAFLDAEPSLLAARFAGTLLDGMPSANALRQIYAANLRQCYRSEVVLGLEQAGYNVIGGLLDSLLDSIGGRRNPHLRELLGELPSTDDRYALLLAVTDYVSGMTDRFALRQYHQWSGIALHSV
jgi:dGTPase